MGSGHTSARILNLHSRWESGQIHSPTDFLPQKEIRRALESAERSGGKENPCLCRKSSQELSVAQPAAQSLCRLDNPGSCWMLMEAGIVQSVKWLDYDLDKRRCAVRFLAQAKIFPQGLSDREADYPPPFSNEVRIAWRYTSTPTRCFLGRCLSKDKINRLSRMKIMQKELEARWLK